MNNDQLESLIEILKAEPCTIKEVYELLKKKHNTVTIGMVEIALLKLMKRKNIRGKILPFNVKAWIFWCPNKKGTIQKFRSTGKI